MTVGLIGVPLAIRHAEAKRGLMGAIPSLGFNGLPGETSHHSSSSSSAPIAKSEIARCSPCAGLNDPPSKPVRIIQTSAWLDQGIRANRGELIRCRLPHSCGAYSLRGLGFYTLRSILSTAHDRDVGLESLTLNPSPLHTTREHMPRGIVIP